MSIATDLQTFQEKRRFPDWTPKAPTTNYVPVAARGNVPNSDDGHVRSDSATEQVVQNCLHFLELELQVANWCVDAEVEEAIKPYLLINALDEDKHDTALRMLSTYYGSQEPTEAAYRLMSKWRTIDAPEIATIYALEMGVFFSILPTLIKHGDVYAATVAMWINDDERVHVETNLRIMREIGQKVTEQLALLVFDTVAYIYAPLGAQAAKEAATRAVKRLLSGKDNEMLKDSLPITIAYFEQRNNSAIVY